MATAPAGKSPLSKNRMARPPAVELAVPEAETQRPSMLRLTAIIATCFAVGVVWPILAGVGYVQRPPGSNATKPLEVPTEPDPNGGGPQPPEEVPAAHLAPLITTRETVSIDSQKVLSCQGDAGEAVARCDAPSLSPVLDEPIAKLADCDAAAGASGLLSLGLHLDFSRGRVTSAKSGQSTTLPRQTAARLIRCAEDSVVGTALDDIEHEHGQYWVYFLVRFAPPGSATEASPARPSDALVSASGQATIGWTTAIVRDAASPHANIVARLSYGTRVNVSARKGDWYRIERGGKSLGWVQRKAIGM